MLKKTIEAAAGKLFITCCLLFIRHQPDGDYS